METRECRGEQIVGSMGERQRRGSESHSCLLSCPDEILQQVFDLIGQHSHRNATSQVCKRFKDVEGGCRSAVFVSSCYVVHPDTVWHRFPRATSFYIKGKPRVTDYDLIPSAELWGAYAAPWVALLADHYHSTLQHLKLKRMIVTDADLQVLAHGCSHNLQSLCLVKCNGFSHEGLEHVAQHCRSLATLDLGESSVQGSEGRPSKWLSLLEQNCRRLTSLSISGEDIPGGSEGDEQAIVQLAARCQVLRLSDAVEPSTVIAAVVNSCPVVTHLGLGVNFPPHALTSQLSQALARCTRLLELSGFWEEWLIPDVLPICPQLRRLDLTLANLEGEGLCQMLGGCTQLQELKVRDIIGDAGMRVVGSTCKDLRTLSVQQEDGPGFLSQSGLVCIAQGCSLLQKIMYYASDMTDEALMVLADNCPSLRDIRICLVHKQSPDGRAIELYRNKTLNKGLKALLKKCTMATRLAICLSRYGFRNRIITDEGMYYLGKYGKNLQHVTLTNCGGSDKGLIAASAGLEKMHTLEMRDCPYGDEGMVALARHERLRFVWIQACYLTLQGVKELAKKPNFHTEIVEEGLIHDVLNPWQVVAYASTCGPRNDMPQHVHYVDSEFAMDLSCEDFRGFVS